MDPTDDRTSNRFDRRDGAVRVKGATRPSRRLGVPVALILGSVIADPVAAISDPLRLEQALETADRHPRVAATPELSARLPRRQALYLDCNRLAFGNSNVADPNRNQPLAALISREDAQRLEIMERFFDVLLADMSFSSTSEAMAVAYIQFDRASVRNELGQISPLRVLELEAVYQAILHQRASSEISQQLTRTLLAQALGDPTDLPRNLVQPKLPAPQSPPALEAILARAAERAPVLALSHGRAQADQDLIRMELRQQAIELLLRLRALDAAERNLRTETAWRDLKLDESRTLYEQEVTADLGYAMSQQTETRLQSERVGFCRTLAWAELNTLIGQPIVAEGAQDQ